MQACQVLNILIQLNYGKSQEIISSIGKNKFSVITKFSSLNNTYSDMKIKFYNTMEKLRTQKLYGVLFHRSEDLLAKSGTSFYKFLEEKKEQNIIQKIGISIYSSQELEFLLDKYNFDIIQAPVNIADTRIINYWKKNESLLKNTELHARSIFLQGLLLKPFEEISSKFYELEPLFNLLKKKSLENNISVSEILFSYVNSINCVDKIIVGLWSMEELQQLISFSKNCKILDTYNLKFKFSENIINPKLW